MGLQRSTIIIFSVFYASLIVGIAYAALWLQDNDLHRHVHASFVGTEPSQVFLVTGHAHNESHSFIMWNEGVSFPLKVLYIFIFWIGCWYRALYYLVYGLYYIIFDGEGPKGAGIYLLQAGKNILKLFLPFTTMKP